MKHLSLILISIAFFGLVACNPSSKQDSQANLTSELRDSLLTANAEKDSLFSLINELSNDLAQIKDIEKLITTVDFSKETPDKRDQLKNDVAVIKQVMEERRKKLAQLEAKLKKSNSYNAEMEKTIKTLQAQIESQEATISEMSTALENAQRLIEWQNGHIDSLKNENLAVSQEKEAVQEKNIQLTEKLNTCYYVVGSKSELKKYNIIETGFLRKTKIMEGDYEKSYFTKADKRTLININLHSKKASILSNHPANSYIIAEIGGAKVLEITDPVAFWELSNFLIVQID